MRDRLWLIAVVGLAILARCMDYERVLPSDDEVVFAVGDAFYHARRALYSFLQFPDLLLFDPCINYPAGARIPHPPLLDWMTAGVARLFGDEIRTFERVAAWVPVLLTSASVIPIAALGRRVANRSLGLLAAAIYAVLPICVNYGQLGNFDHHAPAGLIGACLVLLCVRALDYRSEAPQRLYRVMVGLAVLRLLMMLTWTGSLLYLLPGDAAMLLTAAWTRDRKLVAALGFSTAATALMAWPAAAWLGHGASEAFAAVEFSLLHVLIYGCCALLCAAHGLIGSWRPPISARTSLFQLAVAALPILGASLAVPGLVIGLQTALGFLGASDGYTETVVEQLPIFWGQGSYSLEIAHARMGLFVYLIPFVPIAFFVGARRADKRFVCWFLAGWSVLFGYLAVQQVRYVHDFAPVGSVGMALLLASTAGALAKRGLWTGNRTLLAAVLAALLLVPAVSGFYGPLAGLALSGMRGELDGVDRALLSVSGTQLRFAQLVARSTDGSGSCDAAGVEVPAYGVLAHVGLGHALHYSGKRATPADPFGPYIGRENFAAVQEFNQTTNERRASQIMQQLSARYVATASDSIPRAVGSMALRLHDNDGSYALGSPHLGRFRLVTEGPVGGVAMSRMFGDERESFAPYKLFEFVPGATIELQTRAREQMTLELPLRTPSGRRFVYRAVGRADAKGRARLRVPYANPRNRPRRKMNERVDRVESLGPYQVRAGKSRFWVHVTEEQIQSGTTIQAREFEVREQDS
ncbi:MAG: glycosyltransferase family 39 protein [Deltaproteobacteria bacterium]|nr:glycosyltransferase family 39 protein [Deltaproteobacteria bacterium]